MMPKHRATSFEHRHADGFWACVGRRGFGRGRSEKRVLIRPAGDFDRHLIALSKGTTQACEHSSRTRVLMTWTPPPQSTQARHSKTMSTSPYQFGRDPAPERVPGLKRSNSRRRHRRSFKVLAHRSPVLALHRARRKWPFPHCPASRARDQSEKNRQSSVKRVRRLPGSG